MNNHKLIIALLVGVAISLLSCGDESITAPEPTAETLEKGHDQWSKVEFVITQGIVKQEGNTTYFMKPNYTDDATLYPLKNTIRFEWDGKNVVSTQNHQLVLEKDTSYAMEIFYYNKKGELMNNEFITPLMAPIHQHFFVPKHIRVSTSEELIGDKSTILDYLIVIQNHITNI